MKIWPAVLIVADPRLPRTLADEIVNAAVRCPSQDALFAAYDICWMHEPRDIDIARTHNINGRTYLQYVNKPTVKEFALLERVAFFADDNGSMGLLFETIH